MSERLKEPVSKTGVGLVLTVSSNLTLSVSVSRVLRLGLTIKFASDDGIACPNPSRLTIRKANVVPTWSLLEQGEFLADR